MRLLLRGPARVTEAEAVEERTPAGSGGLRLRARLIDAGAHAVLLSINGAVGPAAPAVTCVAGAPVRAGRLSRFSFHAFASSSPLL